MIGVSKRLAASIKRQHSVMTCCPVGIVGMIFSCTSTTQRPDCSGVSRIVIVSSAKIFCDYKNKDIYWNEDRHETLDELNKSDVYSLRRIIGRDRAMDWGDC